MGGHCVHSGTERDHQVAPTLVVHIDDNFLPLYSSCVVANNLVRMDVGDTLRWKPSYKNNKILELFWPDLTR